MFMRRLLPSGRIIAMPSLKKRKCKFSHFSLFYCSKTYCVVERDLKKCKDPLSLSMASLGYAALQVNPGICKFSIMEDLAPVLFTYEDFNAKS